MNTRLVCKLLGYICLLIGAMMVCSLPWTWGTIGVRNEIQTVVPFESRGFYALLASIGVSVATGAVLLLYGRGEKAKVFRKEAMAVVGLSWLMATFLGALPFWFAETEMGPGMRLDPGGESAWYATQDYLGIEKWTEVKLSPSEIEFLQLLANRGSRGIEVAELSTSLPGRVDSAEELVEQEPWLRLVELQSDPGGEPVIRIRHLKMMLIDCLFEAQSGFSTTGSTVISDLENPAAVQHSILFWRSSTHFLGGLGILVLFVVILGHGSAGKALMQAELPGPAQQSEMARMRHAAWTFAGIYIVLNVVLLLILRLLGLSWFDATCHSFGTMATGGFSTYNASLGHFNSPVIEGVVTVFMVLAGTNFILLYLFVLGQPTKLLRNTEWRTYLSILVIATLLIAMFSWIHSDFRVSDDESFLRVFVRSLRYVAFQVVSIVTTTGFGTHDFDQWNHFGRGTLLALMFIGGCAGSTGGGIKVIRFVLLAKILKREIETTYHPNVVRPLFIDGEPTNPEHRHSIVVYISLFLTIFVLSWLVLIGTEPNSTWTGAEESKLLDSTTAIAATLNNIGPGLGTVGPTQNFGHFTWHSKLLFTWLMMLGRVEIFAVLVLFTPKFWRVT